MPTHRHVLGLTAALIFALHASSAMTAEKKVWVTMGDTAFQQAQQFVPGLVSAQAQRLAGGTQTIHAVNIGEAQIETVANAIHQRLGQCGGFMVHRTESEARAALRTMPAVGPAPSYAIDNRNLVEPILARMNDKNIEDTIVRLSSFPNRYYKSQSGIDASNWLMAKWAGMAAGRSDIVVKQFTHADYGQKSVMLSIAGSDKAGEAIVLGAHLDSILTSRMNDTAQAPGADDDASGVASLTEALRAMLEQGYTPKRTLHVIAYAAEEVGLRGSQEIARTFKSGGDKVLGVLQLDMTNYKGATNDIYLISDYTDSKQNDFIVQLVSAYLPETTLAYDRCGYACSDHASWQALGFPTSMPFESSFGRDNPNIHTIKDTFANSGGQATHALKFGRLAAAFAVELASD